MPSFVADCPRGHKGNFVTHDGYHHCHCGLHVPEFNLPPAPFSTIDTVDIEAVIKERVDEEVAAQVEDAITDAQSEVETNLIIQLTEQAERLTTVDPEYHP